MHDMFLLKVYLSEHSKSVIQGYSFRLNGVVHNQINSNCIEIETNDITSTLLNLHGSHIKKTRVRRLPIEPAT